VPAQMNAALLAGEIDISNVSSVAFGQHAREWLLVPHLSVAAHRRVESVLLFSWRADWRGLDEGTIAVSNHSATSVALVKLLAEQRYGARPRYVAATPDLDTMLAEHDAALLIGDIALVEGQARRAIAGWGRPYVFDLAAESKARGLADVERLAREAAVRLELSADVCLRYVRLLDYDLSERDLAGLRTFLELAVPGFRWSDVRFVEE